MFKDIRSGFTICHPKEPKLRSSKGFQLSKVRNKSSFTMFRCNGSGHPFSPNSLYISCEWDYFYRCSTQCSHLGRHMVLISKNWAFIKQNFIAYPRGLYIYYPIFEDNFFVFKGELWWRAYSIQCLWTD